MTDNTHSADIDPQITALTDIVSELADRVTELRDRIERLDPADTLQAKDRMPGPWVWYGPPAAAEDDPESSDDPRFTVDNFVAWYNITYVGAEGNRAKPIPDCWRSHTSLAAEIATLAYSWRAADIGRAACPREAQYWHHHWRPGFTDRLTHEWIHTDCLDGDHRAISADPRAARF